MKTEKKSDLMQLLAVNNLVPLLAILISFVVFITRMDAGTQLLEYKIDQLSKKVDSYVLSRETAASKMAAQTNMRNSQISELQQEVVRIKTYIKLP